MKKGARKSRSNPFVELLSKVQRSLEPRLAEVLKASEDEARKYGDEVAAMVGAVASLCQRGGKRLRPGLCAVGALSEDPRSSLVPSVEAGVSLELLQAYFLIHDDWMDQDDERRGGPTAHVQLKKILGSRMLGDCGAILAGDRAIALATAHLATVPTSPARLKKCFEQFAAMQLYAVSGQQLDVVGKTKDPELTYRLKTASYTVRGPLLLGAELAGAKRRTIETLDAYSLPAGVAFQLRDDLIGVFSPSKTTGKPQGSDLTEGKNTTLVREGRERLDVKGHARLEKVLGNRKATRAQVARVIQDLEACGARRAVEDRIEVLTSEAISVAKSPALSAPCRALLVGAVDALAQRAS
jgi:geranylgeranyl diphosphate synthase type I